MTLPLRPFPFQRRALGWLKSRPRAILALEQGLGKTVVSAIDAEPPVVVVCTSAMKYTWERELALWRPDLHPQVIATAKDEIDWDCDVWILSYDILIRTKIPRPRSLYVDEFHKIKSLESKRTLAVMAVAEGSERVRYLSGTPMLNRPIELFNALTSVGAINTNWRSYGRKFCDAWRPPWKKDLDVSGASNLDLLQKIVEPYMLRMTKAQVAPDLPPKTYRIIEMQGVKPAKKEKELIEYHKANLTLPENPIAFQAISDIRKQHAMRKLPHVVSYVEDLLESGVKKVVVFAHHCESVDTLVEGLNRHGVVSIKGGTSSKNAFNSVQAFQNDGSVRVFVGNLQAASEGHTLTAASHVVIAEPSWVPGEIAQAADRCHRFGAINPVTVDLLTVQGTIDARMLWVALDKVETINKVIKETKMNNEKIADLLRQLADEFESDAADTTEETKPTRRRSSKTDDTVEETKPARRGRRSSKADDETETDAAEEKKPARRSRRSAKTEDKKDGPTLETVREKAAKLLAEDMREDLEELLEEFGAENISGLKEDQFAEFIKACDEILEEE